MYLPTERYNELVNALAETAHVESHRSIDVMRAAVAEDLGEFGDIWPEEIRPLDEIDSSKINAGKVEVTIKICN